MAGPQKNFIRRHRAILKTPAEAIGFLAALLILSAAGATAGEPYRPFVMDQNYFSCNVPADWELIRDKDKDEDDKIYEIQLVKGSASIFISYYAADNADFAGYEDYIRRNSANVLGEKRNARENYEPVKEITIGGRLSFELSRERLVYLHPESKSDESRAQKEKQYVLSAKKGFYVLHLVAPKAGFPESAPVLETIVESFRPGVD